MKSHPPLPPKSEFFYVTTVAAHALLPLLEDGRCYQIPLNGVNAFQRAVIAAVAETEWRIEAEKWASTPVNDCENFDAIAGVQGRGGSERGRTNKQETTFEP